MSLNALTLSTLSNSLSGVQPLASALVPPAGSTPANAAAGTTAGSAVNPATSIQNATTSLLQSLANGDVSGAQSAVSTLQSDLSTQVADTLSYDASSGGSTGTSPFDQLLSSIGTSLQSSGTTDTALQGLTSYLAANSTVSGNLVNTSA